MENSENSCQSCDASLILQFEEAFRKDFSVIKLEERAYLLHGDKEKFAQNKHKAAMLPFCMKKPDCDYRMERECSLDKQCETECSVPEVVKTIEKYNIPIFLILIQKMFQYLLKCIKNNMKIKLMDL